MLSTVIGSLRVKQWTDKKGMKATFSLISPEKYNDGGTQNCLNEEILMLRYSIYFYIEVRNEYQYVWVKRIWIISRPFNSSHAE